MVRLAQLAGTFRATRRKGRTTPGGGAAYPGYCEGEVSDTQSEEVLMGLDDKIGNKAEEAAGKVKEQVGDATDNERLEAEGKVDQTEANLKKAGEDVKDAFR